MAKRHRKRRQTGTRRPAHARTLAPEAFRRAVLWAQEAASTPHPLLHERVSPHVLLQHGDHHETLTLNDTPLMRLILALRQCYPLPGDWLSAYWRFQALYRLLEQQELSPWAKPVETGWDVDDAVFFVAATAPLDANRAFLLTPFCEALMRWAQEHPETPSADAP